MVMVGLATDAALTIEQQDLWMLHIPRLVYGGTKIKHYYVCTYRMSVINEVSHSTKSLQASTERLHAAVSVMPPLLAVSLCGISVDECRLDTSLSCVQYNGSISTSTYIAHTLLEHWALWRTLTFSAPKHTTTPSSTLCFRNRLPAAGTSSIIVCRQY